MERISYIQYRGKNILLQDFSNIRIDQEYFETLKKGREVISSQPQQSILAIFDATGAAFNTQGLSALKEYASANTPYMKCSTVVGITGLLGIAMTAVTKATGRSFHLFADRQAALDFLVKQ